MKNKNFVFSHVLPPTEEIIAQKKSIAARTIHSHRKLLFFSITISANFWKSPKFYVHTYTHTKCHTAFCSIKKPEKRNTNKKECKKNPYRKKNRVLSKRKICKKNFLNTEFYGLTATFWIFVFNAVCTDNNCIDWIRKTDIEIRSKWNQKKTRKEKNKKKKWQRRKWIEERKKQMFKKVTKSINVWQKRKRHLWQ